MKVTVIIPTLNEEEGIGPTLKELHEVLGNLYLLVVDGNSTDKTVEIAKEYDAEVLMQRDKGKGSAIEQAIDYLRHRESDISYVVFIDADFTYPAEHISAMISILDKYSDVGMVTGNRINGHFNLGALHNLLYVGNRMIAFIHNLFNGVKMIDPLTGLRVIRWEVLKDWRPRSESFDIEVEMNRQVEKKSYRVLEIPIHYRPRLGEKKLRVSHGVTILKRILLESVLS